jgi:hypothetical protein
VIFDHPGGGIIRFIVRDLPEELPQEAPARAGERAPQPHRFFPFHDPIDLNYPHSEIRCSRGGEVIRRINSAIVIKEFQTVMSRIGLLLLEPDR